LSGLDFPKTASLYVIYELPFYKGQHGFLGKLLGGYQTNTTWRYSSGNSGHPLYPLRLQAPHARIASTQRFSAFPLAGRLLEAHRRLWTP